MTLPLQTSDAILESFVLENSGKVKIKTILIANNGIAALKAIRSVRRWCYETFGNDRLITMIVMATPEDLAANADYVRLADQYIQVPGGENRMNYANVNLIVDLAERYKVDAVFAGWGHASENPRLPEALSSLARKIVFLGPSSSAMRCLGDKIASTIVAQSANVPTISWSGDGLVVDDGKERIYSISDDLFRRACVKDVKHGLEVALRIGFPVMIKSSEGGGGKGIRKSDSKDDFEHMYNLVMREVPGSPIFIMKLATEARHVEVQILADEHGNAISLYGRDCSVQRRHQKIIEEAPVSVVPARIMKEMEQSAIRLAKMVGYVSAGTIEYLFLPKENKYYFLELNPRLQVEHPTTEMVSKVNIPAAQLQIGMGIPLTKIKDIRTLFQNDALDNSERRPPIGHVIACRITAENPDLGFQPNSGKLTELVFRGSSDVWGYFSVNALGGVHEFADSQFGHIFAHGDNREVARKNLVMALKEMSIRSDFRTTVEYLIEVLELEDFRLNKFHTNWLDALIANKFQSSKPDRWIIVICGAVIKAYVAVSQGVSIFTRMVENGQFPMNVLVTEALVVNFIYEGVSYSLKTSVAGKEYFMVELNQSKVMVHVVAMSDGGLLITIEQSTYLVYSRDDHKSTRLIINGRSCLLAMEDDPSVIRSPSSGKVVRFLVQNGDAVKKGTPFAEMEVMKMYMALNAPENGKLHFSVKEGVSVDAGDTIAILELEDPQKHIPPQPETNCFPSFGYPHEIGTKPHQQLRHSRSCLEEILDGFDHSLYMKCHFDMLIGALQNPLLPLYEIEETVSSLRIPESVGEKIKNQLSVGVAIDIKSFIGVHSELDKIIEKYQNGLDAAKVEILLHFLQNFLDTERVWQDRDYFFSTHRNNISLMMSRCRAHYNQSIRIDLVRMVLETLVEEKKERNLDTRYQNALKELSCLKQRIFGEISSMARDLLSKKVAEVDLHMIMKNEDAMNILLQEQGLDDSLIQLFFEEEDSVRLMAMEAYIRRIYSPLYNLHNVSRQDGLIIWEFQLFEDDAPVSPGFGKIRSGCILLLKENDDLMRSISSWMKTLPKGKDQLNVLYICCNKETEFNLKNNFSDCCMRRITTITKDASLFKTWFCEDFEENLTIRHIEPALAFLLELSRMKNYEISSHYAFSNTIFVYKGVCHENDSKLFVRVLVKADVLENFSPTLEYFESQARIVLGSIMEAIEECIGMGTDRNEIFIHCLVSFHAKPWEIAMTLYQCVASNALKMMTLRLSSAELRIPLDDKYYRIIVSIHYAYMVQIDMYVEENGVLITVPTPEQGIGYLGPLHQMSPMKPYPRTDGFQVLRNKAQGLNTTFVYDFPLVFEQALKMIWHDFKIDSTFFQYQEGVLVDEEISFLTRPPGMSDCALVVWKMEMTTPEAPNGREIIVIANDITRDSGSFSIPEDDLYCAATRYAVSKKVPLFFLSANSGARIGFCKEIQGCFKVIWKDQLEENGVESFYLDEADYCKYGSLVRSTNSSHPITGEKIHLIESIVGNEPLGVENLQGSAKMARETANAYRNIFTISLATGRSVGIGAYLLRLGKRIIQKEKQAIILTGYQALNKVLGKDVYSTNLQLGGPNVMGKNGVAQLIANSDLQGILSMLRWLSYSDIVPSTDPICRDLFLPALEQWNTMDPRLLVNELVDKGSFMELSSDWATSVIVGRARLGGRPVAIIMSDHRNQETIVAADPADPRSLEFTSIRAGQVWYPDSAHKTAEAIEMANLESLPLLILANWRGFSGGQRDMHLEMLKFGAMIVEQLRIYTQPIFVYLLPYGELRGGAWMINPEMIEMIADPSSRGGILEPEGIVEIKYRSKQVIETINRCDAICQSLLLQGESAKLELAARHKILLPHYQRMATQFADLHDRPLRMKDKNVVDEIVEWRKSREYLCNRLFERCKK